MSESQRRLERAERSLADRPPDLLTVQAPLSFPHALEFVTDSRFLGRPLYPRQATLLKVLTLGVDLLTEYDLDVIGRWEEGFTLELEGAPRFVGSYGTTPGTVERMQANLVAGRLWFREVTLVLGRRAGKGFLTSCLAAYQLWWLLNLYDPQTALGLERTKQLALMVFGTERDSAVFNLFGDIRELVTSAACFAPFIDKATSNTLRLFTPEQRERLASKPRSREQGRLVVDARATTATAGRGPAGLGLYLDEMAHMPGPGLARSGDEVYASASPALAQFRKHALTVMTSSPREQIGEFHTAYLRALAAHPDGAPRDPGAITFQLPSWDLYDDWQLTHTDEEMH
jgi:hypothetical protein